MFYFKTCFVLERREKGKQVNIPVSRFWLMSGNAYFFPKNIGRREGAMGAGFSNLLNKGQFKFTRCAWNSFTEREAMLGLDKVEEYLIFYPQLGLSPLKIPRCVRLRYGGETRLGRTNNRNRSPWLEATRL